MEKLVIDNYEFTLVGDTEYEGKLNIWDRETLVFVDDFEEIEDAVSFIKEKINWINENKELILDSFMIENDHYVDVVNEAIEKREFKARSKITYKDFVDALFINNVSINVSDSSFMIDLDAEPDYLFGHLATLEIDDEYNIEFGGMNG
ncbi:hypothetical protein [Gemelliphila palaticanis]|uniref:DUF2262 domain-containing protein n=1 Tax=Gemelliphila palaticanis TaxID=81950 RepID=A0ABX2SZA5_9BACL|nr:hypothetical protein [Gemella palaticanis]MBF0715680.1 hypothetical protein [Gemella palaticanis]NYS47610.1 hypothetical protein [Gemella palaticanis]